jgi:hypothetical protein
MSITAIFKAMKEKVIMSLIFFHVNDDIILNSFLNFLSVNINSTFIKGIIN